MKTLILTRNERIICLFMLAFLTFIGSAFYALGHTEAAAPPVLCSMTVSIMTTTAPDTHCL